MAPITLGDKLPSWKKIHHKDGVEEKWNLKEAAAIRGLASGYSAKEVCTKLRLLPKTLRRWMGNPFFMTEVKKLSDHYLFEDRPAVLKAVGMKARQGSAQHARLYLMVTGDLRTEAPTRTRPVDPSADLDSKSTEELDSDLVDAVNMLSGKAPSPGDVAEQFSFGED